MNSKPYKLIFALLSISLLAILLIQGLWIRNFYAQKADEFNKAIYQTLAEISVKLNERENIQYLKKTILPKQQSKVIKSGNSVKVIVSSTSSNNIPADVDIIHQLKLDTIFEKKNHQIVVSDSLVQINNGQRMVIVNKSSTSTPEMPDKNELNKLLDKMISEIKIIDDSSIEDINEDSLRVLISRKLENKGFFTPFEFCLKKETKHTEDILAKSKGFNLEGKVYKADLSNDKIFSNHNYLYLQFPEENSFVFSGIKNMLLLSIIFSLIMIIVFYVTLKTILKQKKLGEIKNDFINNMTHELKTPIATISLAIDAINNPQIKHNEEKFNQYTSILKEENQKLNNHVERVLQIALLDKSELQLHKSTCNLIELINSSINNHQLQIKSKQAQVVFNHPQTNVFFNGDEFHLLNVFNNLLDNALKYSSDKCSINISIAVKSQFIEIVFKDNGIGIDSHLHQKVFDKFFRVQGGNLHDVKGFGLGLSYVKSIVESHRGTIELQSQKNKGSEFIIKLPLHEN